ncbi:uncharacterized protein LOC130430576 isoform X2 [Triplophysa dalaica]|uniref:uncharacterized protein LOC130430576 isoform X2 n=1 Tax=Triplophysa dalaica TaxID=1582913 RepID=UPI0024DF349C|nr:uncharacterized protein LOC130430576 isoform X2 [Triplophysa dalaica]
MGLSLISLCLSLLIHSGVFSDAGDLKSVSVMNGDSVTLNTYVIKHKDDVIMWYYGPKNTFVARINGKANSTMYSDDEMFKDRLKMNDQTGDLTITNITSQHSGVYTLNISKKKVYKTFNVNVSGEVKSVSVREGHSVILYTHVLKQGRDLIEWTHGPENTLVAIFDENVNRIMFSKDERFIDRVKLDDQTGALMIHETTSHHSGLHTLKISNNRNVSYKTFEVTIQDVRVLWHWVISAVGLLLLICVCILTKRFNKNFTGSDGCLNLHKLQHPV